MEFVDECGTLGNAKKIFKEEKTMDNFIFSVNVTIPIFLIILLGYILRRIGFLTDEFVRVANKYVFIVALPVMLFRDIAGSDVRKDMNVKFEVVKGKKVIYEDFASYQQACTLTFPYVPDIAGKLQLRIYGDQLDLNSYEQIVHDTLFITVKKKKWGYYMDQRVTEVKEVYEYGGGYVVPTFGSPLPEKIDWSDK